MIAGLGDPPSRITKNDSEIIGATIDTGQYSINEDMRHVLQVSVQQWQSMTKHQKISLMEPLFLIELSSDGSNSGNLNENIASESVTLCTLVQNALARR